MQKLQFWIEFGSTYTYLSVARIGRLAAAQGVEVTWEPFYLVPLLVERGLNQGPFLPWPSKLAYMWRDIERRAARAGVSYSKPSTYPVGSLQTARIACIAVEEGWCQPFTENVFALHWTENRLIGSDDNLNTAIRGLGRDPTSLRERAQTPEIKKALRRQTDRARALGIFGAPSFVCNGELFWGDDRLEDALEWASRH